MFRRLGWAAPRTRFPRLFAVEVTAASPPAGLTPALAGLWWDAKGDWTRAPPPLSSSLGCQFDGLEVVEESLQHGIEFDVKTFHGVLTQLPVRELARE
jgi:hypothetical protein